MKKETRRHSDSGQSLLYCNLLVNSELYESSVILNGKQSHSVQMIFASPEKYNLPPSTTVLSKNWERLSRISVGLLLRLRVEKSLPYILSWQATLTNLPFGSTAMILDSSDSNLASQLIKPLDWSEQNIDIYSRLFDFHKVINGLE